jgi:hypothetical protein
MKQQAQTAGVTTSPKATTTMLVNYALDTSEMLAFLTPSPNNQKWENTESG